MVRQGLLVRAGEKYPVISLTAKGDELLHGNIRVMLPVEGSGSGPHAEQNGTNVLDKDDETLFLRLKSLRRTIAERDAVPAYMVFPDASLREMARVRPGTGRVLRRLTGSARSSLTNTARNSSRRSKNLCRTRHE